MIGDAHRGYLMELAVTKTLAMQQGVQIIGMSATLSVTLLRANQLSLPFANS